MQPELLHPQRTDSLAQPFGPHPDCARGTSCLDVRCRDSGRDREFAHNFAMTCAALARVKQW